MVHPFVRLKNFISEYVNSFILFIWVQISLPRKTMETANILYTFIVEIFRTNLV